MRFDLSVQKYQNYVPISKLPCQTLQTRQDCVASIHLIVPTDPGLLCLYYATANMIALSLQYTISLLQSICFMQRPESPWAMSVKAMLD
jgi:hypothetical protein